MKESPSVCGEFEFLLWFSFLCLYAKGKLHNFSDEFNFVVHQSENVHCHLWVLCTLYWQKSSGVQTEIAVCGNHQRVYACAGHLKGGEELQLIFAWKVQSFSIDRLESRVTHRFIKSIRLMALVSRHQSTLNQGLGKFDVNAMIWGQQQQQSGEPSSLSVRKKVIKRAQTSNWKCMWKKNVFNVQCKLAPTRRLIYSSCTSLSLPRLPLSV